MTKLPANLYGQVLLLLVVVASAHLLLKRVQSNIKGETAALLVRTDDERCHGAPRPLAVRDGQLERVLPHGVVGIDDVSRSQNGQRHSKVLAMNRSAP